MKSYRLKAADDRVQKLAHETNTVRAVIELVWNTLHADAHPVTVVLHWNETDVEVGTEIADDGHGMARWKTSPLSSNETVKPLDGTICRLDLLPPVAATGMTATDTALSS